MAYLSRVLESAFTALEGLNKQAFLTELVWELFRTSLGPYICDFNLFSDLLSFTGFVSCLAMSLVMHLIGKIV